MSKQTFIRQFVANYVAAELVKESLGDLTIRALTRMAFKAALLSWVTLEKELIKAKIIAEYGL